MSIFSRASKRTEVVAITMTNRTVVRIMLLVVATLIGLSAVKKASHALILLFTAFFLALALNGPVQWLARRIPGKHRGNRSIATAASFLIVILFLIGFFCQYRAAACASNEYLHLFGSPTGRASPKRE